MSSSLCCTVRFAKSMILNTCFFDCATFFVHVLFFHHFDRVFLKQEEVDHVDEGCHSSPQKKVEVEEKKDNQEEIYGVKANDHGHDHAVKAEGHVV